MYGVEKSGVEMSFNPIFLSVEKIHSIKSFNTGYTADPLLIVETEKVTKDISVQQYQLGKSLIVSNNKGIWMR